MPDDLAAHNAAALAALEAWYATSDTSTPGYWEAFGKELEHSHRGDPMTPNPYPECPICTALHGAQGGTLEAFLQVLRQAAQQPCLCPDPYARHPVLFGHPHAVTGCVGFGVVAEVAHG